MPSRNLAYWVCTGIFCAVLGFSVDNASGKQRYFPMYGSTYRGLPAVTLEVFVSSLRKKLEAEGRSRLIHTKRGVGYVARVTR